ncbi:heme exporter protein B [Thiogranum longum]|uniref:Heme exporter protein B n=1 Tax=Thiogranum longum TaxID=1537524 RepID=A0A4R1HD50_9GAMM|nr:heme exporter protein CcmB [Thiogranum longum]TCK18601.1 heme exporter protein B [Thiogranum longum]
MTPATLPQAFSTLLRRDLTLAYRRRSEMINPLLFFVLVTALFPLGISADPALLREIGPGIIWVAALLASLLSLETVFRSDFDDGSLEQLLLSPHPLSVLMIAKVLAHWLITGLPLLIVAPLLGVLLNLSGDAMQTLLITLALGTPVLSLVGAIGVALTVGLRKGGTILSLLVLPLYVPVLIFAASAVASSDAGLQVSAHLSLLTALLILAISLSPAATAASLRISMS